MMSETFNGRFTLCCKKSLTRNVGDAIIYFIVSFINTDRNDTASEARQCLAAATARDQKDALKSTLSSTPRGAEGAPCFDEADYVNMVIYHFAPVESRTKVVVTADAVKSRDRSTPRSPLVKGRSKK